MESQLVTVAVLREGLAQRSRDQRFGLGVAAGWYCHRR
jgi:hypothetical protein